MLDLVVALIITGIVVDSPYDGDTFHINKTTIRMLGIDAPELKQPYGIQSRDYLKGLILNQEVQVDIKAKDKYGRSLGWVYRKDVNINELLIKQGKAWAYEVPKKSTLRQLEAEARQKKLGLWADSNPQPPWEFRANARKH